MENGVIQKEMRSDTSVVVAWYALDIPVSAGPETGGLPGLILELDINKGSIVFKAVEISEKIKLQSIKEPTNGRRISAEDFRKERQKLFEQKLKNTSGNP